jgi:chloride channel protein, CIC family
MPFARWFPQIRGREE